MRFNTVRTASLGLLAIVAAGCASSQGGGTGSSSTAAAAASGKIGPGLLQWSGRFQSTQQQSGAFGGMRTRNQATGTAVFTANGPSSMNVVISFSIDNDDSERLLWSLAGGDCGTNALPLMPVSQFPPILTANGRGTLRDVVPIAMPLTGSYHVNVFNAGTSGQDQADVMICAPLNLERRGN